MGPMAWGVGRGNYRYITLQGVPPIPDMNFEKRMDSRKTLHVCKHIGLKFIVYISSIGPK